MELTDCQTVADTVRTSLAAFTNDCLTRFNAAASAPAAEVINFQPLYDTLSGTLEDLKAAQEKLDAATAAAASVGVTSAGAASSAAPVSTGTQTYTVSETATPLTASSVSLSGVRLTTPLALDGPVLPPAA